MKTMFQILVPMTTTVLVAALTSTPVLAAEANPFQASDSPATQNTGRGFTPGKCGMCGGAMQGRCGGMMDGMMMGGAMPKSSDPTELPEPDTTGAKLVSRYCTQCHGLPGPKRHSATGWPGTVARMNTRMQWMSRSNSPMNISAPTADELDELMAYLIKHASTESETPAPDSSVAP